MKPVLSRAAHRRGGVKALLVLLGLMAVISVTFLSVVHADAITATHADGLLVYAEGGIHTSRYRLWNSSNDFTGELTDTHDNGGDIQWVVVRGAPTRDEMIVGLETDEPGVHVQILNASDQWHNSTELWADDLYLSTGVPNAAYRAFDIAYESLSGDALIVYENDNTNNKVIAYRVWNGSNYTAEQSFTTSQVDNPYRWVALTPRTSSDDIMLLVHNGAGDLYAVPWNGTAFDASKQQELSTGTTSNTAQHFAFAWEESSGQGLVGYGEASNFVYRTYSPTPPYWSTEATIALGNGLGGLRMCSEPTSDYIGLIWQDAGNDVQARVWDGTQMLANPPSQEGATETAGSGNVNVDCAWFNASTALFGFIDTNALSIDYFTFTKTNTWSTSDLEAATNNSGDFAADDIKGLRFVEHPKTSEVMVIEQDLSPGGDDVRAIRWNGTHFETPTTYILETDTEPRSGATEAAMFDWYRYDPPPNITGPSITNVSPVHGVYSPFDAVLINATVVDNIAVDTVLANVTMPNGTIIQLTMTDGDADSIYNTTFTGTTAVGTFTIRIIANDTDGHVNSDVTTTFNVTESIPPNVTAFLPVNSTIFNVSEVIEVAANVTDNLEVSAVVANITLPNGTATLVTLSLAAGSTYNGSFTIPLLIGMYNVTFIANDTTPNINDSEITYFFANDTLPPNVSAIQPTNVNEDTAINYNATVADNIALSSCNLYIDNINNGSMNISGGVANRTVTFSMPGTYTLVANCSDSSGNFNDTSTTVVTVNDTTFPVWSSPFNETPVTFNTSVQLHFNITWIDNFNLSEVWFEVNRSGTLVLHQASNVSATVWNLTLSDFPAGTHYWRSNATDSQGNVNTTGWYVFTISKIAPTINLTLNGTAGAVAINEGTSIWLNGSVITGDSNYNITIWENSTLLHSNMSGMIANLTTFNTPGTYNISLNYTTTQNYTHGMISYLLIVEDLRPPIYSNPFNETPATFNASAQLHFNITWAANTTFDKVLIEVNRSGTLTNHTASNLSAPTVNSEIVYNVTLSDFPAGTHAWRSFANDTFGNSNITSWYFFTIAKIAPTINLTLNGTAGAVTIDEDTAIWLNGTILTGDSSANLTLWRDTTFITWNLGSIENLSTFETPGTFNVSLNYTSTQNYTATTVSHLVTVNDVTPPVVNNLVPLAGTGHFNDTDVTLSADLTDNFNVSLGWVNVRWANGSMLLNLTLGTAPTYSVAFSNTSEPGVYNVTFFANDTTGNLNSTATTWFNVTLGPDTASPVWANPSATPASPANYSENTSSRFNVTWTDDYSLDTVLIEHNFTGTLTNYSVTSYAESIYYYDYGPIAVGTYVWRMYANDTTDNADVTSQYTYNVTRAIPTLTVTNNTAANTTYGNVTNISCAASSVQVTPVLYRNGTKITNSEAVILAAGTWVFTCNSSQTANYTTATATSLNITINKAAPTINLTLNGTAGTVTINEGTSIWLNGSVTTGDSNYNITIWENSTLLHSNVSGVIANLTTFNTPGTFNISLNYTATQNYSYGMISYLLTVEDLRPPVYSNPFNETPATFNASAQLHFNITWAANTTFDKVLIEVNRSGTLTNHTASNLSAPTVNSEIVYNVTLSDFPAGTHAWRSFANDTFGNSNITSWYFFTIAKIAPTINLTLNGTAGAVTIDEDTAIWLNGSLVTGDVGSALDLYLDGASKGSGSSISNLTPFATPGTYNISLNYTTTQNYTAGMVSHLMTVNDVTPPAYSNAFNSTPSVFNTSSQLHFNITWTDNFNFSAAWFEVNRSGTLTLYLASNVSATVWNLSITSDFPAGTHYWRSNASDDAGNINTTDWYAFTIAKAAPTLNLTLNGTEGAVTIDEESSIWLNGSIVTGDADVANLTLYLDGAFKAWNLTWIGNLTTFADPGTYNVSLNYTTTENYTAGMTSHIVTVRDTSITGLALNTPAARFNTTSATVQFNFTATDTFDTTLDCSLVLDSVTNYTNATVQNGTDTVLSIGSLAQGDHYWNVTCTDADGNSNTSATRRFTVDSSAPRFLSITTDPSTADDLDPNLNITVIGNLTDNFTQVRTVILQRRLSTVSTYTNQTMTLNSSTGFYEAIFNATSAGLYYFRLIANDTVGNSGTSNLANATVQYDYTWTRTPADFDPVAADPYANVTIGNLTINNTGDYTLNFSITSDSDETLFNESANFSLAAKEVKTIEVNDTASTMPVKTLTLTITATPNGEPTSQTVGATIVAAPGQPVLAASFTTPSENTMTVTQGDTHIAFVASLRNIGQGNASNVTFTLSLPPGWDLTYGSTTASFDEFYSGDEESFAIEVDIPSNATTGTQYVIVNCTGLNESGTNLTVQNLTFGDSITVTVNRLITLGELEAAVAAAEVTTTTTGGGGYAPSTLAGIFERVLTGEELLYSAESFELVRGYNDSFPVSVKNIFDTTTLYNVTLKVEGYFSQYITTSPAMIDSIGFDRTKSFNISIISPDYMEKGTHQLTLIIGGKMLGPGIRKDFTEKRTVTLIIHTVSEEEAGEYLKETFLHIEALEAEGITSTKLTALLTEAEKGIAAHDYDGVKSIAETVKEIKETALVANNLLQGVKAKIKLYKATLGILLQASPDAFSETQSLLNLATAAFERGDYETAMQRMSDAQLALALERGDYSTLFFFIDHWLTLLLISVVVCLELVWGYKRYVMLTISRRIRNLEEEQETLLRLMKEAQQAYFVKKSVGPDSFHRTMDQYQKRLSKVKQLRSQLRHKRVHLLKPELLLHDLELERADMTGRLKALQKQYFVTRKINKKEYEEQSKVYNERVAQIEDELWSIEF